MARRFYYSLLFSILLLLQETLLAQTAVLPSTQIPIPSNPTNGNIVYSLNQTLSWYMNNTTGGPFTYDVQYSTDSTFVSGVIPIYGLSTTSLNITLPSGNTHYYWRVRAKNSVNEYTDFCSPANFWTDASLNGAPVPVASWPSGNSDLYEVKPTLIWYTSTASIGGTVTYEVEIEPYSTPFTNNPTSGLTGISGNSVAVPYDLTGGIEYHWQVRSVNSNNPSNPSAWSNEAVFSVDFSQGGAPLPVLSWPIGSTVLYTNAPTFSWYINTGVTGSVTYEIVVTDTTTHSLFYTGTTSDNSIQLSNLKGGHTYSWTVRSHNASNVSAYASLQYFSVDPGQNGAPVPIASWPTGGARLYTLYPTYTWYLPGSVTGGTPFFDLEVTDESGNYTTSTFHKTYHIYTGYSFTTPLLDYLTPGQTYYWHVRTQANFQTSAYSTEESFSIDGGQSASVSPKIYGNTGGATINTVEPNLNWYITSAPHGTASYEVEIKPIDENFDGNGTIKINSNSYKVQNSLVPGTAYHWRVRLNNSSGVSSWSDDNIHIGAEFVTEAISGLPVSPLIGGPDDYVTVPSNQLRLSWYLPTAPKSAQNYIVEVSKSPDMSNPVIRLDNVNTTSAVLNSLKSGTYYWRVRAVNDQNKYSLYSQTAVFNITGTTAVNSSENSNTPKSFKLEQNYPNPFNPTTVINYSIPKQSLVVLKVYNILGKEVAELVNQEKAPGKYSVEFNASRLSSGVYFYQINAGNFTATKKLMLLK